MAFLVLPPTEVDPAKRAKPRFKLIERTHTSAPYLSVAGIARATRYPDVIDVRAPRDSRIIDIDLHLYGFAHAMPEDLDILLVAPNGQTALVMSDAGTAAITRPIDVTLDDDAKRRLPRDGPIGGGRYRPANYDDAAPRAVAGEREPGGDTPPGDAGDDGPPADPGAPGQPGEAGGNPDFANDDFPSPAPEPGGAVRLSTFHGLDPSGPWSLFVRSDGPAAGEIGDGWGLTITVKKRR
jgi:hypothetical protein